MEKIRMKLNGKIIMTAILAIILIAVVIITVKSFETVNKRRNLQMPDQRVMVVEETTVEESTMEQSVDEE